MEATADFETPDADDILDRLGGPAWPVIRTPWPALDDTVCISAPSLYVLAVPAEPNSETAFHLAQAAAKQGHRPVCLFPGWSPHWDGTLNVHRDDGPVSIDGIIDLIPRNPAPGVIIIDQTTPVFWQARHAERSMEGVFTDLGEALLGVSNRLKVPVVLLVRRRKSSKMSIRDLGVVGGLEYGAYAVVMVDPDPDSATAVLHVAKHRAGPAPLTKTVPWEVLPRTLWPKKA